MVWFLFLCYTYTGYFILWDCLHRAVSIQYFFKFSFHPSRPVILVLISLATLLGSVLAWTIIMSVFSLNTVHIPVSALNWCLFKWSLFSYWKSSLSPYGNSVTLRSGKLESDQHHGLTRSPSCIVPKKSNWQGYNSTKNYHIIGPIQPYI